MNKTDIGPMYINRREYNQKVVRKNVQGKKIDNENKTNMEGTTRGRSIGHSFYVIQKQAFPLLFR